MTGARTRVNLGLFQQCRVGRCGQTNRHSSHSIQLVNPHLSDDSSAKVPYKYKSNARVEWGVDDSARREVGPRTRHRRHTYGDMYGSVQDNVLLRVRHRQQQKIGVKYT